MLAEGGSREQAELAAMCAISGKSETELVHLQHQNPANYQQLAQTAGLFPSAMVDAAQASANAASAGSAGAASELGEIPEGWEVGKFGDMATLLKGSENPLFSPQKQFEHYSLPSFDAGQQPVFELGIEIKSNKTKIKNGVLLHSKLNPHIPRVWFPYKVGESAVCSTEFLPWIPTKRSSAEFLFCLLKSPEFESRIRGLVTGTSNSHQRVKPDQVQGLDLILPSKELCACFSAITRQLFCFIGERLLENSNLAKIRDTLLPKLLSGEIDLTNIQSEVA